MIKAYNYGVFGWKDFSGNTACVIESEPLDRCVHNSEVKKSKILVFVKKEDNNTFRLSFFSEGKEITFCAHGTLAASRYLYEKYNLIKNKFNVGDVVFSASCDGSKAGCNLKLQSKYDIEVTTDIEFLLNSAGVELNRNLPFSVYDYGSPKLLLGVKSKQYLYDINIKREEIFSLTNFFNVTGIYFYFLDNRDLVFARSFNPALDDMEDIATGVAASALGDALFANNIVSKVFSIIQGPSPGYSKLILEKNNGGVFVSGQVKPAGNYVYEIMET